MYERRVGRALAYLPVPKPRPRPAGSEFAMLVIPEIAAKIFGATDPARLVGIRADAESLPSRPYANALVNIAWRNGPVEMIHAWDFSGYPLDHRWKRSRTSAADRSRHARSSHVRNRRKITPLLLCHSAPRDRLVAGRGDRPHSRHAGAGTRPRPDSRRQGVWPVQANPLAQIVKLTGPNRPVDDVDDQVWQRGFWFCKGLEPPTHVFNEDLQFVPAEGFFKSLSKLISLFGGGPQGCYGSSTWRFRCSLWALYFRGASQP